MYLRQGRLAAEGISGWDDSYLPASHSMKSVSTAPPSIASGITTASIVMPEPNSWSMIGGATPGGPAGAPWARALAAQPKATLAPPNLETARPNTEHPMPAQHR